MKKRLILPLLCVLAVAAFACNNETNNNTDTATTSTSDTSMTTATIDTSGTETTGTTSTTSTGSSGGTVSSLDSTDKEFVMKAAQGGMAEVMMGQLASSKGTSPDVKNFGNRMVTDHGKANDELKQLAQNKGLALPADADKESKEMSDKLSKLSGKDFDREYIGGMVEDHEKDVKEFEKASKEAKDPDLKAWATKTLPTLQDHLKMAKDTKAKLK
ncbi:MAG: putative rane protein [Thermoanaerobaculia bacterium]|jgi:putative membrane protein|nr:putative rane protein [Thermoanaerobaculia bacterium]